MPIVETTASQRGSKGKAPRSVYVHLGIWYDPKTGFMHLAAPKEKLHTVISDKQGSVRYQPKFFAQLKRLLLKYKRWPLTRRGGGK